MKEYELMNKLERVNAPPDFEQRVMTLLSERKKKKKRTVVFGYSLAGAFSTVAVLFIILNIFILPQRAPLDFASGEQGISSDYKRGIQPRQRETIPIIEAVDYSGEIEALRYGPSAVYILEEVSDKTDARIKY